MLRVFHQYVSARTLLLFPIESLMMIISFIGAAKLLFWNEPLLFSLGTSPLEFTLQAVICVALLQVCFYCNDLYDLHVLNDTTDLGLRLIQSVGVASLLLGFLFYLMPSLLIHQSVLCAAMILVLGIAFVNRYLITVARLGEKRIPIVIFGTGSQAQKIAREIVQREKLGFSFAGFATAESPAPAGQTIALGRPILFGAEALLEAVQQQGISRIVVATEERRGSLPVKDLVRLRMLGVQIDEASSFVSALTGRIWLDMVRPSWLLFSDGFRRSRFTYIWKRTIDLAFAVTGLLLSSPLLLLAATAIAIESGAPILYRQTRVGLNGKHFELLKLRSMRTDAEADGKARWAQQNDTRVTRLGAFLRKYRIDELPQFINVIRGDMSFVGPRPERPVFVDQFREQIPYYDERHLVRPGITGWAQVEAAYGASMEDTISKLEYDLFYLKNLSLSFDGLIIFSTLRTVLMGRGSR
jgi:sugar transferase (PEP-CTERM system associated)